MLIERMQSSRRRSSWGSLLSANIFGQDLVNHIVLT